MLKILARQFQRIGLDVSRYNHSKRLANDSSYAMKHLLHKRVVRTIFDVGANLGQTAKSYRASYPDAAIHSFEPSETTFQTLVEALRHDSKTKTWQLAISDVDGVKEFFLNEDHTTNSLLAPADHFNSVSLTEKLKPKGISAVNCLTLDTFCKNNSIQEIDLLKMDIQGAELQAIHGGSQLFRERRVGLVFCEVMFSPLYQNACDFGLISAAMKEFNYPLYGLYNLHHFENDGLLWGDAIFINPNLISK